MGRDASRLQTLEGHADELVVADALDPTTLPTIFQSVDSVISCLGASVIPLHKYGRQTFTQVDYPANANLIRASNAANINKFVYVSVFGADRLSQFDFVRAHEMVSAELRGSGLNYVIIRPTGFFSSMEEIILGAGHGLIPEVGDGSARINPISEADLATYCVKMLEDERTNIEVDVGGPEILTRRQIAELAQSAIGDKRRLRRVPVTLLKVGSLFYRPFNPRVSDLMTFIAEILGHDLVAPAFGDRTLTEYFRELG